MFALSSPTGRFDRLGQRLQGRVHPTARTRHPSELLKLNISKLIPTSFDGPYATTAEANHIAYVDPDNSFARDSNAHDLFSSSWRGPSPLFSAYSESAGAGAGGQMHMKASSIPPRLITLLPTPTFILTGMELFASGLKGRGSPFPWSTKASTGN